MNKFNVAIIGAGIGQEHLAAYLELPDRFKVKTLCDIDEERAKSMCGDHSNIQIETNFDTVLEDKDIDIIDICLPPHLHFKMSMDALAAGKHVICEKPLVNSLKDADLLAAQAEKYDRVLTPVFQYRFGPAMTKLNALIEAGYAGRPLVASIETHWHRDKEYYNNPWRGTWKGEQGGAVLGHAIHNHDLLCAVFGPIEQLSAFTQTRVNDIEVEDCASISFQMKNGALASSSITLGAAQDTTRLRFCFEKLTAESGELPYAPAAGDWKFISRGPGDIGAQQSEIDEFLKTVPAQNAGYIGFFDALWHKLNGNTINAVSFEDGRRSLELVSAIYQSTRSKNIVHLPLSQDDEYYHGWMPKN